jgi:hypothetical protein
MPKPARFRKTVRVTSGKGGGKRVNAWNTGGCLVFALIAFIVLGPPVGICAFWLGMIWR